MIRFDNDYSEGAHPTIIERLVQTNLEQTCGYGLDQYCLSAQEKIKDACQYENIDVHFLVGGTQTNTVVINAILRPHQGVLSADTGHINTHESGAIESTGHKVLALKNINGKITAKQVEEAYTAHILDDNCEHCVQPAMVYISFPTESGTLYNKNELVSLYSVCQKYHLPLFIDGARMSYGLMSPVNDLTLNDLCTLSDVFYLGGTKCGTLFGEALIIKDETIKKDFRYLIKRHGGLLAKGRLLGLQFDTLFDNQLYLEIAKHAIDMAMKIKEAAIDLNIPLYADSYTNQQFLILKPNQIKILQNNFSFTVWEKTTEHIVIRICTSWATKEEHVEQLIKELNHIKTQQ